ncbi:hypothetical protein AAD001_13990 [Colwelliaceae bacterium 6471]
MSLTDLKKNKDGKRKKRTFTVDEFISDAENYAKGTPEIVSHHSKGSYGLKEAVAAAHQYAEKQKKSESTKPFRHATFTLSEEAIEQLTDLAEDSKLAKSRIIRILIDELCNKEQHDKLKKLLESDVG